MGCRSGTQSVDTLEDGRHNHTAVEVRIYLMMCNHNPLGARRFGDLCFKTIMKVFKEVVMYFCTHWARVEFALHS